MVLLAEQKWLLFSLPQGLCRLQACLCLFHAAAAAHFAFRNRAAAGNANIRYDVNFPGHSIQTPFPRLYSLFRYILRVRLIVPIQKIHVLRSRLSIHAVLLVMQRRNQWIRFFSLRNVSVKES